MKTDEAKKNYSAIKPAIDYSFSKRLKVKRAELDACLYQGIIRRIDHLLDENGNFRIDTSANRESGSLLYGQPQLSDATKPMNLFSISLHDE